MKSHSKYFALTIMNESFFSGVAVINSSSPGNSYLNNINFAAKYGLEKQNMNHILIFDLNFYKSNEVKHMFYDDPRVLYISMNCCGQGASSKKHSWHS